MMASNKDRHGSDQHGGYTTLSMSFLEIVVEFSIMQHAHFCEKRHLIMKNTGALNATARRSI